MTPVPIDWVRALLGAVIWAVLIIATRWYVVRHVASGQLLPGLGAIAFGAVMGLIPWILMATGALPFAPVSGLFASVPSGIVLAVLSHGFLRSVAARGRGGH